MLKLNLGCGYQKSPDHINIDKSSLCQPDQVMDMEVFPWPFADDSVEEIILWQVLEHLGQTLTVFQKIIQEIYRILAPNGRLMLSVPDPHHINYLGDPTHCRPITPKMLHSFSRAHVRSLDQGLALPSTLPYQWGIDFNIIKNSTTLDTKFKTAAAAQNIEIKPENLRYYHNAFKDHSVILEAVKPAREA